MKIVYASLILLIFNGVLLADETGESVFTISEGLAFDLAATLAFGLIGVILLTCGFWIFDKILVGCDFIGEVAKGNIAAAIVSTGMILGLSYMIGKIVSAIIGI